NGSGRRWLAKLDPELDYAVEWESLCGYLAHCEAKGVSQNVASYIGATTLRTLVAGYEDRPLTAVELETVRGYIKDEMSGGALGIGSLPYISAGLLRQHRRVDCHVRRLRTLR